MKTTLMIATVLAAGTSAYAQDPVTVPPPPAASAPVQTAPAPARSTLPPPDRESEVRVLGGVLVQAMNQGAADLVHQMQLIDPGSVAGAIISEAHAHGIALEGYGVLFDVDVPLMNMSLIVTRRQIVVQNLRAEIDKAARLRAHAPPDVQDQLDARIQMLTNTLYTIAPGVAPPAVSAVASPVPVASNLQQPPAGSVVAATADVTPAPPLDDQIYSDAIKAALMNAMVNHSSALMLGDDEWLVVAARDNGPSIPGAINDRSGIILRIKGSDLAAFRANKLSRDEVLKRIEIHEWR
jgi:hypothetical protein